MNKGFHDVSGDVSVRHGKGDDAKVDNNLQMSGVSPLDCRSDAIVAATRREEAQRKRRWEGKGRRQSRRCSSSSSVECSRRSVRCSRTQPPAACAAAPTLPLSSTKMC